MHRWTLGIASLLSSGAWACGTPAGLPAPSYGQLYAAYFAPGTPGHCATSGCHGDPGHNVWLCESAESCYAGMLEMSLIDPVHPERSAIADGRRSPLVWFNPSGGNMPLDSQASASEEARDALAAWLGAGARGP
jgi:hypothetical protein